MEIGKLFFIVILFIVAVVGLTLRMLYLDDWKVGPHTWGYAIVAAIVAFLILLFAVLAKAI